MNSQATIRVLDFEDYTGPSGSSYNIRNGQIVDNEYYSEYGVNITSCNFRDGRTDGNGACQGGRDTGQDDRANVQVAFDTGNFNNDDADLQFKYRNGQFVSRVDRSQVYRSLSEDFGRFGDKVVGGTLGGRSFTGGPGNVLILQENTTGCSDGVCNDPDDEGSRAAGFIDFNFSDAVSILSLDFFDVDERTSDSSGASDIQFFTIVNGVEEEISGLNFRAPDLDNGGFARTFFGVNGVTDVSRLRINLPGSGAIDNLVFHTGEVADVPAPSTFGLFALVFAGMFYSRRKA
jgi:hypothetical protein